MNETQQLSEHVPNHVRTCPPGRGHPLAGPLGSGEVTRAEGILGFALPPPPPLLVGLYPRVGDGASGPRRGLLPLRQAVPAYAARRSSGRRRPEGRCRWPTSAAACTPASTAAPPYCEGSAAGEEYDRELTPREGFRSRT